MGVVYSVRHPEVDRPLALKLLSRGARLNERAVERFRREGQALAKVRHPAVLQVHAAGEAEGGHYLVTDRVEGESLRQRWQREPPLGPHGVARIGRTLADALETAHTAGVLHRDVKPQNVILRSDGEPVLLDFGLARSAEAQTLTQTGAVLGTPAYMSPEQADGMSPARLDGRTDVYGLGATLFALLARRAPFEGREFAIVVAVLQKEPTWPRGVPAALEAIVRRAMHKKRERRYASAAELRDALDAYLAGESDAPRAWHLGYVLWVLAALGVAAACALRLGWPAAPPPKAVEDPPPDASGTDVPDPSTQLPGWFQRLEPRDRPPFPLPEGVKVSDTEGRYTHAPDRSELVWVPPGVFRMGNDSNELAHRAERPAHQVTLTRGFFLGVTEVTRGQYRRSGQALPQLPKDMVEDDRLPVTGLTHAQASRYCERAGLRLPSEAEWEWAARGPEPELYPWGVEPPGKLCNLLGSADGCDGLSLVGAFPEDVSWCGCLDMGGNAQEWVADWSGDYSAAPQVDPAGPNQLDEYGERVLRGGGCFLMNDKARSTSRTSVRRDDHNDMSGLRVALSPR